MSDLQKYSYWPLKYSWVRWKGLLGADASHWCPLLTQLVTDILEKELATSSQVPPPVRKTSSPSPSSPPSWVRSTSFSWSRSKSESDISAPHFTESCKISPTWGLLPLIAQRCLTTLSLAPSVVFRRNALKTGFEFCGNWREKRNSRNRLMYIVQTYERNGFLFIKSSSTPSTRW